MFSLHYLNLDFKVPFFILNDKKIETIFIHSACYSTTQWRTKIAKELIKVEKIEIKPKKGLKALFFSLNNCKITVKRCFSYQTH